jgi:hypothetical protein
MTTETSTTNGATTSTTYYPGLCSEYYLGPNSADPNLADNVTKTGGGSYGKDLGFRWRLSQRYAGSLKLLLNVQNANTTT